MEVPNRQVLHPIVKVFPVETTIIHAPSVAIRSLPRRIRGHEGAKLLPLKLGLLLVIVAHVVVIVLIRCVLQACLQIRRIIVVLLMA